MNTKLKSTFAVLGLALATSATLAIAGAGEGPRGKMKAADTNGDGMISKAEAATLPRLAKDFDAIDANKDGLVAPDEMRAFHGAKRAEHWKKLDADGDGKVSKAEAQANAPRLAEHFDQLDANKDGAISAEEMKAAHGKRGRPH
jgi:hypothetical protein